MHPVKKPVRQSAVPILGLTAILAALVSAFGWLGVFSSPQIQIIAGSPSAIPAQSIRPEDRDGEVGPERTSVLPEEVGGLRAEPGRPPSAQVEAATSAAPLSADKRIKVRSGSLNGILCNGPSLSLQQVLDDKALNSRGAKLTSADVAELEQLLATYRDLICPARTAAANAMEQELRTLVADGRCPGVAAIEMPGNGTSVTIRPPSIQSDVGVGAIADVWYANTETKQTYGALFGDLSTSRGFERSYRDSEAFAIQLVDFFDAKGACDPAMAGYLRSAVRGEAAAITAKMPRKTRVPANNK